MVDVALAVLRARAGDRSAIGDLHALAKDAEARHWLGWSLESRLAAYDVLAAQHDPAAAPLRAEIASSAREHGFGWVLRGSATNARDTYISRSPISTMSAGRCAKRPTVTTPAIWLRSRSIATGSAICKPCTSRIALPLSVTMFSRQTGLPPRRTISRAT